MINYKKINNTISKIIDVYESLNKLNKDELIYLKASIEIKLELDKISKLENYKARRWVNG